MTTVSFPEGHFIKILEFLFPYWQRIGIFNHTGKPGLRPGFCKTAMVRTVGFRAQLIANHCSFLMGMRVSTLRTIIFSCAYQNPQNCAHSRNTLETPCCPKQWGAVPDPHLGWVSSARMLQLRAGSSPLRAAACLRVVQDQSASPHRGPCCAGRFGAHL
jgi:hypothetical protein